MAPGQEANGDNLGSIFDLLYNNGMTCVLILIITKTYLYNFDPLKPHFYMVKLGFTGVYISFHISAQNI